MSADEDEKSPNESRIELRVSDGEAGQRVDIFIAARRPDVSRRTAQKLCSAGSVRIDGRRARKSDLVRATAVVSVELLGPEYPEPEPSLALDVRLERPEFVVVCKAAGMPTAPLHASERNTLCGALLGRYPEMRGVGHRAREPGIVHRLDTQTSGLVLAARSQAAFQLLSGALDSGALEKRYLAVVSPADLPDAGRIERALAPDPAHPERVLVPDHALGSYARFKTTEYRVLRRSSRRALVELSIKSAFRHQIRAHLASLGFPIIGDRVYGGDADARLAERHALHASHMAWAGEDTLKAFAVDAPLPPELLVLLEDG